MEQSTRVSAPPDAVIFIPSVGRQGGDQSVDSIAGQIATELDRNAITAQARFTLKTDPRRQAAGPRGRSALQTIVRHDGNQETPVLDLYGFDYRDDLVGHFLKRNAIIKSMLLLLVLVATVPRFVVRLLRRPNKSKGAADQLQLLYGLAVLSLLMVYTGILLVAAAQLVVETPSLFDGTPTLPTITPPQVLAILMGLAGVFFPTIKERFAEFAVSYVSIIRYLLVGERRAVACGRLASLLEHITERPDADYNRIHIVSFGFGSIIAIDALHPQAGPLGQRFSLVDTLVTIGCPFDIIRSFFPSYFQARYGTPTTPSRWLNVYTPIDVLGSNFREDSLTKEANQGVEHKDGGLACPINLPYDEDVKPSTLTWLWMTGLRSHSMYWGSEEGEASCFGPIVQHMYTDHTVLA